MPAAARVGDQTSHGTLLGPSVGSLNVLISKKPAWIAGFDTHTCPLYDGSTPHAGGVVKEGSKTVFINGAPAVRQGDSIVEVGTPNPNFIISGSINVSIGE